MANDRRQIEVGTVVLAAMLRSEHEPNSGKLAEDVTDALLPLIDRVAAEAAAEALSAAANDALRRGRQRPNSTADWLIDRAIEHRARAAELRAPARTDEEKPA